MDQQPTTAPPVVAVVVTRDPEEWFDDALDGLAAQDYPNVSVLVIDAGSDEDPADRIARALPTAYVRHLDRNPGFGPAANEVLDVVEGAAFFLFCHDDVVLDPSTTRLLVEEAFRSNAGIVGPKQVRHDRPDVLLDVGWVADRLGTTAPRVDSGELDQAQHDSVRDVFLVDGACTLVRADLFAAMRGFDPSIDLVGEDLDLCWRAHVAGARVIVAPSARVRHVRAHRPGDVRTRRERHRLRTVLSCYGPLTLAWIVPVALTLAVMEVLVAVLVGRARHARAVAEAWTWNVGRIGELRARRRHIAAHRLVSDREVRRLQTRGSARMAGFARDRIAAWRRLISGQDRPGASPRLALTVWGLVGALLFFGSRHLIFGRVPVLNEFAAFPESAGTFLADYLSGWRSVGLGAEGPSPTAFGLLGLVGLLLGNSMGLVRQLLVLGCLPLGALGVWRLTRATGSTRARLAGTIVYLALPLPYDSLAEGRWGALIAYAVTPFVLLRLARASHLAPFGEEQQDPAPVVRPRAEPAAVGPTGAASDARTDADTWGTVAAATAHGPASAEPTRGPAEPYHGLPPNTRPVGEQVLALGLLLAVTLAIVPVYVTAVLIVVVGVLLGSAVAGGFGAALRAGGVGLGATVVGVGLHLPWMLELVLPGAEWAPFGGIIGRARDPLAFVQLLRFDTDPGGVAPLGWGLLAAAALPLLIGRGWRLAWSGRAWGVAGLAWLVTLVVERGWIPVGLGDPATLLAPAGAGLALAVAMGVVAFEHDLRGFGFGWRQLVASVAALGVAAAMVPVVAGSMGGRWDAPRADFARTLSFLDDEPEEGGFRVLWVGDPSVLPLRGWELTDGVAYATSDDGMPDARALWTGSSQGPTRLVHDALGIAGRSETTRLGRLLAPMGVRYVVLADRAAPELAGTPKYPLPDSVVRTFDSQIDLRRLSSIDGALRIYENVSWAPVRAALDDDGAVAAGGSGLDAALITDLSGSEPVLVESDGHVRWTGPVPPSDVLVAVGSSDRWELRVDGAAAPRQRAFGWANLFSPFQAGDAVLRYRTAPAHYVMIVVQAALWAIVARQVLRNRVRAGAIASSS